MSDVNDPSVPLMFELAVGPIGAGHFLRVAAEGGGGVVTAEWGGVWVTGVAGWVLDELESLPRTDHPHILVNKQTNKKP